MDTAVSAQSVVAESIDRQYHQPTGTYIMFVCTASLTYVVQGVKVVHTIIVAAY